VADDRRSVRNRLSSGDGEEDRSMSERPATRRVLQVLEATLGGTRRYLENVFDALGDGPQNGLVYSMRRADSGFLALLEKLRGAGWMLFELEMQRSIEPRSDFACVRQLQKIYRSFRPDVVHAHSSKAGAIARLATMQMGPRPGIVYSPHAIGVNLSWLYGSVERLLALRLDILAAVTPSERDELRALKMIPSERIHVVVPTIRSDVYLPADRSAARAALGLPPGPLVIAVGRLSQQKDPLAFVDFVAALRRRVPGVQAFWIGDGELRAEMESCIASSSLSDVVRLTGWIDDVRPYIAASNILVSTSSYESFGYVTAEALAMDRPVVASAITGTIDIVTTDTVDQLYLYRDVDAAAALAERLLRDAGRASEIAARGRSNVLSTFSVESMRLGLGAAYAAASRR
jgi:glycosyltransferase involved in cell wall biosynthesis